MRLNPIKERKGGGEDKKFSFLKPNERVKWEKRAREEGGTVEIRKK